MTIVIISHKDDLDGIISAALIKRIYMKDKKNNIKIFLCSHYEVISIVKEIDWSEIESLYLLDLPLNDDEIRYVRNINSNVHISYFDHHYLQSKNMEKIRNAVDEVELNYKMCSAEIIEKKYQFKDSYIKMLVLMSATMDFMKKTRVSNLCIALAKILSILNLDELIQLVDDFAQNEVLENGGILKEKYRDYLENAENIEKSTLNFTDFLYTLQINDIRLAILYLNDNSINIKYIFWKLSTENHADIYMIMIKENQNIFISKSLEYKKYLSIDLYCANRGGGGRNDAGGFKSNIIFSEDNYRESAVRIIEELNSFREEINR